MGYTRLEVGYGKLEVYYSVGGRAWVGWGWGWAGWARVHRGGVVVGTKDNATAIV